MTDQNNIKADIAVLVQHVRGFIEKHGVEALYKEYPAFGRQVLQETGLALLCDRMGTSTFWTFIHDPEFSDVDK
jgi:hypothetical protein